MTNVQTIYLDNLHIYIFVCHNTRGSILFHTLAGTQPFEKMNYTIVSQIRHLYLGIGFETLLPFLVD